MQPEIKRMTFLDEWITPVDCYYSRIHIRLPIVCRWILPPVKCASFRFTNFVMAFRIQSTDRESALIKSRGLALKPFLTLRPSEPPLTFSDVLGQFVPQVNPSKDELLVIEMQVRMACATWTHFFESMSDPL